MLCSWGERERGTEGGRDRECLDGRKKRVERYNEREGENIKWRQRIRRRDEREVQSG